MMMSAADRLSMESESSLEPHCQCSSFFVHLLMIGDAFRRRGVRKEHHKDVLCFCLRPWLLMPPSFHKVNVSLLRPLPG